MKLLPSCFRGYDGVTFFSAARMRCVAQNNPLDPCVELNFLLNS